jgi:hypothetical protein
MKVFRTCITARFASRRCEVLAHATKGKSTMKYPVALYAVLFSLAAQSFAQDGQLVQGQSVPSSGQEVVAPPDDAEIKPQRTNCWTSEPGCAGLVKFMNTYNQHIACTVYFDNGKKGSSSFVMPPKQGHQLHVRTGDTCACVYGNAAPPSNAKRGWIWVQ